MNGKLFAFGCSMTRGDALDDIWDHELKQTNPDAGPSKFAWPQVLADNMNLECVNLGVSGSSNKHIWYNIVTTKMSPGDKIFVQWTSPNRWCVIDTEVKLINAFRIQSDHKYSQESDAFYHNLYSEIDMDWDLNLRMSHADYHARSLGVEIYHLTYDKKALNDLRSFNNVDILDSDIHAIQRNIGTAANDKNISGYGHPCAAAHATHADCIYKEIMPGLDRC